MKRSIKIIVQILLLILLMQNNVQALSFKDMQEQADNFVDQGEVVIRKKGEEEGQKIEIDPEKLKKTSDDIFSTLFIIGTAIATIVGGILGIQFMVASAEDKAQIKEKIIPYIVGCVVIFGAFGIWRFTIILFEGLS